MEILVNGTPHPLPEGPADRTLLTVLRDELRLTGTKYGCGEGQCGACTVLLDGTAAYSCQLRLANVGNRKITTIEGLARGTELHPVQQAFLDEGAFQCGYCTPGLILATVALLARTPAPDETQIRGALEQHICRCGGYPRILAAVKRASALMTSKTFAAP